MLAHEDELPVPPRTLPFCCASLWYEFYREKLQDRKSVFLCKFCGQSYKIRNATRMTKHLINKCKKYPAIVKSNLKGKSALSDVTNGNSNTNSSNSTFLNIESANSTIIYL